MKHIKNYENFSIFDTVKPSDRNSFILIYNSLYEYHLSLNEKNIIELEYGSLNESWYTDLVDKGKRGVLQIKSDAGQLLVDLATKARDILDFAKQLANKIGEYVKAQFNNLLNKVKNKALKDAPFVKELVNFIEKKNTSYLTKYVKSVGFIIEYITNGKLITNLITRLSELFSSALKLGTNEGLSYLENEFLFEEVEGEVKKNFLQRLADKIKSYPPFSWIPKLEDLLKKGIMYVGSLVDKFFAWLEGKGANEAISLTKDFGMHGGASSFGKGFYFLFQILELYIQYLIMGQIEKFKGFLNKIVTGTDDPIKTATDQIKDQSLEQIWKLIGINGEELINNSIKKIPYVGQILAIMDMLVVAVGSYLAIKPSLDRIKNTQQKPTPPADEAQPNTQPNAQPNTQQNQQPVEGQPNQS